VQSDHWKGEDWETLYGDDVEFTLVYDGPLLAHNEVREKAAHKHAIRKQLHPQLRRLWSQRLPHWINSTRVSLTSGTYVAGPPILEQVADKFAIGNYRFVPLVTENLALACKLDILFLRREIGLGRIIQGGDIDNRIKTLFDALRRPTSNSEIGGHPPGADEDPFFCLLEDDALITEVVVRADTLLTDGVDDVKLVIRVTIKPIHNLKQNADFS
jgi:hypothetical protein